MPCILIPDLGHVWFVLLLRILQLHLHLLLVLLLLLLLLLLLMHFFCIEPIKGSQFISIFSHICTQCSTRSLIYSMHAAAPLSLANALLSAHSLSLSGCAALLQQQLPFSAAAAAVAVSASRMSSSPAASCACVCMCMFVHLCVRVCACACDDVARFGIFCWFFNYSKCERRSKCSQAKKGCADRTRTHTHIHALWRSLHVSRRQRTRTQTQTQMRNKE